MAVRIMFQYKTGSKVRTDAYTSSRPVGTGKSFSGIKRTERVVSMLKIYLIVFVSSVRCRGMVLGTWVVLLRYRSQYRGADYLHIS